MISNTVNNSNTSSVPIRAWVARVLSYRGRNETFGSLPALFQALCERLREAGTLPGVYGVLAQVKQRIMNQGQPLCIDDVAALVAAHQSHLGRQDPLTLGAPRFVLSIQGAGERMAYHRELVHNLKLPERPLLTLNAETMIEVLAVLLHSRHFTVDEKKELVNLSFPQQDGLGVLRILDTLYKSTFSRTIRKDLCDPKIFFPLPEGSFQLVVDHQRAAHVMMPVLEFLRHFLFRLYRTPDLATVLDSDDRSRSRIQDGLRLLHGSLQDTATLPQKREEVAAILRARPVAAGAPDEELEELEEI